MPNTVRLHRVLATRPEKVYRAFLEAERSRNGCRPMALPVPYIIWNQKSAGRSESLRNLARLVEPEINQ